MKEQRKAVNGLFTIPLIFAAALLSFAHGGQRCRKRRGSAFAINDAVVSHHISGEGSYSLWVMMGRAGAFGRIDSVRLDPKLIKTVAAKSLSWIKREFLHRTVRRPSRSS